MPTTGPPSNSGNKVDETRREGAMMPASTERLASEATASADVLSPEGRHPLMPTPEDATRGPGRDSLPRNTTMLDDNESKHRPPMSVIVVSSPAASEGMELGPPSGLFPRREPRATTSSVFSTPFRLQPRNAMAVGVTGRDGAVRGRKRSAQSMSVSKIVGQNSLLAKPPVKELVLPPPPPPPSAASAEMEGKSFLMGAPSTVDTTPKRQPLPCGSTPPRDHHLNGKIGLGRVDNTMVNFQCLSLQSPKRKEDPSTSSPPTTTKLFPSPPHSLAHPPSGLPPSSSASSSSGTAGQHQRPAMVPGSVGSFQSPAAVSNSIQPRSSFTPVYNSASPGGSMRSYGSGSIGSNARMNASTRGVGVAAHSPSTTNCGGSTKSSPKLAPLTVLQDRGAKLLPNRDSNSRLPPLPGGGMSSLWLSLESSHSDNDDSGGKGGTGDDDAKMWPPRTVHCRKPSSDSISTVQNSVLSPIPRPSPRRSPGGGGGGGGAFSSPASALGGGGSGSNRASSSTTPRSVKQRRVDEYTTSPSQPTPRTPRTPLPRVTLTPRSTGSRRSRRSGQQGLPRFPSPSDVDMDVTSPFLNSAAVATLRDVSRVQQQDTNNGSGQPPRQLGTISSSFPASSNSLALSADGSTNEGGKAQLPVLDLSPQRAEGKTMKSSNGASSPMVRELSGGSFMGIQTMSLLNPSHSGGILQAMMEEGASGGIAGTEMGSVSDIDEDEGFILASPSAIEEERFASCQPARQRRRRSCDRYNHAPSVARGSPSLSPNANLAGMNYVTSNTSLFGMDIAHPTEHAGAASAGTSKALNDATSTKKAQKPENLAVEHGLVLANPQEDVKTLNRRKSDASFDSVGLALDVTGGDGGRDLVTPPAMANPETPPPLSPKEGFFMPVVMPEGTVQHNFARRQTASVCIAGADKKSVTMAIARMATEAQGHSESSPVL